MPQRKPETFDYVIATRWKGGGMCFYTYMNQIQHGTMKSAEDLLDYVNSHDKDDPRKDGPYKIYKINYEEIK